MTDELTPPRMQDRPALPMAMTVAAVVLALALGLWAGHTARKAHERTEALAQQFDTRIGEQARQDAGRDAKDTQTAAAIDTLAAGQASLGQRLDSLYGARRGGLLAAEAEHMVRLAAQRLALLQDPAGALALLAAADGAIRDIRDADTHAARAAIAADSLALRAAGSIDIEALYLRLAELPEQAEQIAALRRGETKPPPTKAVVPEAEAAPQAGDWWSRAVAALSSLVTLRRVDEQLAPMITDGERALAAQNFRLLVEHAQVALLQRQPGIYTNSLAQADTWLTRIASGDPAQRAALHREITALRATDIGRPLPGLTASLAATRALAVRLMPESGTAP